MSGAITTQDICRGIGIGTGVKCDALEWALAKLGVDFDHLEESFRRYIDQYGVRKAKTVICDQIVDLVGGDPAVDQLVSSLCRQLVDWIVDRIPGLVEDEEDIEIEDRFQTKLTPVTTARDESVSGSTWAGWRCVSGVPQCQIIGVAGAESIRQKLLHQSLNPLRCEHLSPPACNVLAEGVFRPQKQAITRTLILGGLAAGIGLWWYVRR